ncbi:MAG TPA: DUF4293 family protein [Puia sp.]|nr:DUF4293 family protein [Puia sp.]
MLQRLQTLWLLLAATANFLTFKYSFFSGNKQATGQSKTFEYLTATTSALILVLSVVVVSAILIDIFLYKNRKLQLRIAIAAILISTLNIFLYYRETKKFVEGNYDLSSIFVFAIPVLLIFAASGIYKDQRLVKSLDRLR